MVTQRRRPSTAPRRAPADLGYATLTFEAFREGKQFVSRCLELDTSSCGDTLDEAFENVKDATLEYLTAIEQLGQRQRVFRDRGIRLRRAAPALIRQQYEAAPGTFVGTYVTKIPVSA
jgi:hypothetical protein